MSDLSNAIYEYYFGNLSSLTLEKRFHFLSRLYLFYGDKKAAERLRDYHSYMIGDENIQLTLKSLFEKEVSNPNLGSKNAAEIRADYFRQYPLLLPYLKVMFRTLFVRTIYNLDATNQLLEIVSENDLKSLYVNLSRDSKAIATLSTHAVNYLYLYHYLIINAELDTEIFTNMEMNYDQSVIVQLQLLIYFYTHCIIASTQFYYRPVPPQFKVNYENMLNKIEDLIAANYDRINLDNKFEFLVCAKILGKSSNLESKIFSEAGKSQSDQGSFLIDRINKNPQSSYTDLTSSEHRNVLFILANNSYVPQTQYGLQ